MGLVRVVSKFKQIKLSVKLVTWSNGVKRTASDSNLRNRCCVAESDVHASVTRFLPRPAVGT
jgi:hypothetical protein